MDPFTILGAVGTCASLIAAITRLSSKLVTVKDRWNEGAESADQLALKLSSVQAALSIIRDWAGSSSAPNGNGQTTDLRDNLHVAVEGCQAIIEVLDNDVSELVGESVVSRMRQFFLLPRLREHERRLDSQLAGLQLLVNAAYCANLSEQNDILRSHQSQRIFQTIRDDTTTIREESTTRDRPTVVGSESNWGADPGPFRSPSRPPPRPLINTNTNQMAMGMPPVTLSSPQIRQRPQPFDTLSVVSASSDANTSTSSIFSRLRSNSSGSSNSTAPSTPIGRKSSRLWSGRSSPVSSPVLSPKAIISKRGSLSPRSQHSLRFPGPLATTEVYSQSNDNLPPPKVIVAAHRGDWDEMTALIRNRADIRQRHSRTARTPLLVAAHCGHDNIVDLLVTEGCNLDDRDKYQLTALHLAAAGGYCRVVNTVLDQGANINIRGPKGRTPLRIACEHGQLEVIQLLIRRKAMIDARDESQRTPLHAAADSGDFEIAKALLSHGANKEAKDNQMKSTLHMACEAGHSDLVSLLLENKANVEAQEEDGMTPLCLAAKLGRVPILELLLRSKASAKTRSAGDQTPLHWASFEGHEEIVDMLLRFNKSKAVEIDAANINGRTPLHLAAMGTSFGVIEKLLAAGANIEATCHTGYRPVHYACLHATPAEVSLLLNWGADAHARASGGATPLHLAVKSGSWKMAKSILAKGCPVDARDADGNRPLVLACAGSNLEMVQLLLDAGAQLRSGLRAEPLSDAPVCVAAAAGYVQILQALLERGAAIREVDGHGWQPLRHAAFHGHAEAVACLLGRGARATDLGPLSWFAFSSTAPPEQMGRVTELLNVALESETAEHQRVVQLAQTAQPTQQAEYSELGGSEGENREHPVGISADEEYQDNEPYTPQPETDNRPAPYSPPPMRAPPPPPGMQYVPYRPSRVSTLHEGPPDSFVSPSPDPRGTAVSSMSTYVPSPMATADYGSPPGSESYAAPRPTNPYSVLSGVHDPSIGTPSHLAELD